MELAIVLGLLAAFAYGTADFLARLSGRGIGVLRTMFLGQSAAAFFLTLDLVLGGGAELAFAQAGALAWISAIGAAAFIFCATAMLFQGLAHGTVSVVAPVAAAYGGVTALLSILTGEHLSLWSGIALAIILTGAMIVSVAPRPGRDTDAGSGLWWAVGSALLYGTGFWIQGTYSVPRLGPTVTLWVYYLLGTLSLGGVALVRKMSVAPPGMKAYASAAGIGVLSASGYVALLAGFRTGHVGIVAVLSGLASAVTVLLCRFILKEHVSKSQWSGIAVLLLGLAGLRVRA